MLTHLASSSPRPRTPCCSCGWPCPRGTDAIRSERRKAGRADGPTAAAAAGRSSRQERGWGRGQGSWRDRGGRDWGLRLNPYIITSTKIVIVLVQNVSESRAMIEVKSIQFCAYRWNGIFPILIYLINTKIRVVVQYIQNRKSYVYLKWYGIVAMRNSFFGIAVIHIPSLFI